MNSAILPALSMADCLVSRELSVVPTLLVNCRFLTRPLTGVDRTASELVRALAGRSRSGKFGMECAVPNGAPPDTEIRAHLDLAPSIPIHRSRLSGYAWEQLVLARLRPEATLLSLCNTGPVLRRNQLAMIHDTQVHDTPESYSLAFRAVYRLMQPLLARRSRALVTVSQHSRTRMIANKIGHGRPIHVVHNGADHFAALRPDPTILDRLGIKSGEYLFALSHPARHKNIAMLLRACMRRVDRALPLVLAGPGDAAMFGVDLAAAEKSIRFAGRVSNAELKALYENARIFLFPSLTEGFGFPVLEAMSCGCPVIASDAAAIEEVVGDAAAICHASDESGWTREIELIAHDAERLASLSATGLERASQFSWQRAAAQIESILDDIPAQTNKPSRA